jgi:hypothetical protein
LINKLDVKKGLKGNKGLKGYKGLDERTAVAMVLEARWLRFPRFGGYGTRSLVAEALEAWWLRKSVFNPAIYLTNYLGFQIHLKSGF